MPPESPDRRKRDEGLHLLVAAVKGLRDDLTSYRWTLERWLKRGRRAFIAIILLTAVSMVAAGGAVYSAIHTGNLLEQVQSNQSERAEDVRDHRERNEKLHACLVDLVLMVVRTSAEERPNIQSPCPEPVEIPKEELRHGTD